MTNKELEEFVGIAGHPRAAEVIRQLDPKTRALYDRMARLEHEVELWQSGLGPKPTGVIICMEHGHGKAKRRKAKRPPDKRFRRAR